MRARNSDPLVSHIEFHSESKIINETGYRSHFSQTALLEDTIYETLQELVTEIGEILAKENGYE